MRIQWQNKASVPHLLWFLLCIPFIASEPFHWPPLHPIIFTQNSKGIQLRPNAFTNWFTIQRKQLRWRLLRRDGQVPPPLSQRDRRMAKVLPITMTDNPYRLPYSLQWWKKSVALQSLCDERSFSCWPEWPLVLIWYSVGVNCRIITLSTSAANP